MSRNDPEAPSRPDREPPDPADVGFVDEDEGLDELDKTLADSFPASDPPQAP